MVVIILQATLCHVADVALLAKQAEAAEHLVELKVVRRFQCARNLVASFLSQCLGCLLCCAAAEALAEELLFGDLLIEAEKKAKGQTDLRSWFSAAKGDA